MRLDPRLLDRLRSVPVVALEEARAARAFAAGLVTLPQALDVPEVATALTRLLDDATGVELVALDRASRTTAVLTVVAGARVFTTGDVARASLAPLVLLSMMRDGRLREAATLRLAVDSSPLATRALFVRLDDTVDVISDRAARGLEPRLVPERASELAKALDLIELTSSRRRTDEGARLRASARDLMFDPRARGAVDEALRSSDAGVRAAAARFAVQEGSDEARVLAVLERSLADDDASARRWAAHQLNLRETPVGVVRKLAPKLARDPLPAIRSAGARAAQRVGATAILDDLCCDSNGGVRALARTLLGRAGGDVERERVRSELMTANVSERICACLAVLSEIGRAEDFPWIARHLHDERLRVQAAAVHALVGVHASEGLESFADVLHDKLGHGGKRIAFEAARGLSLLPRELVRSEVVIARQSSQLRMPARLRSALAALVQ